MTPIFITPYTFELKDEHMEFFELASETIPNQALTVEQMLFKYSNGTLPAISKTPIYDENVTFESLDPTSVPAFDLADYTDIASNLDSRQTSINFDNINNKTSENQNVTKDKDKVNLSNIGKKEESIDDAKEI